MKHPVEHIEVKRGYGIPGGAHSGNWHRQISLLASESVDKMKAGAIKSGGEIRILSPDE